MPQTRKASGSTVQGGPEEAGPEGAIVETARFLRFAGSGQADYQAESRRLGRNLAWGCGGKPAI